MDSLRWTGRTNVYHSTQASTGDDQACGFAWISSSAPRAGARLVAAAAVIAAIVLAAPLFTEDWYWARIIAWRESTADDYATRFVARDVPNATRISTLRAAPADVLAA